MTYLIYFCIATFVALSMVNLFMIVRRKFNIQRAMLLNVAINQSVPVLIALSVVANDATLIDISFFYIALSCVPILSLWFYYQSTITPTHQKDHTL